MNNLSLNTKNTMDSHQLLGVVNIARVEAGENQIRLSDLNNKIADELDGEHYEKTVVQNPNKTQTTVFILTIDQCVLVGMRESKQVRRNLRDKLKFSEVQAIPQTYADALQLAANQAKTIEQQQSKLIELKPKADFHDEVVGSSDTVNMSEVAKVLNYKGYGRNKLFQFLRDKKVLQKNNDPYQTYIDRGYFRLVESTWKANNGDTKITIKTVVFQKGVDFISKILKEIGSVKNG